MRNKLTGGAIVAIVIAVIVVIVLASVVVVFCKKLFPFKEKLKNNISVNQSSKADSEALITMQSCKSSSWKARERGGRITNA